MIKRFCPVDESYTKIHVHSDSLPWFWIGIKYSEDNVITMTDVVNNSLEYGMRVTPEYLAKLAHSKTGIWRYMDSKTLEEKDFPSEGFIIEDVCNKSVSNTE